MGITSTAPTAIKHRGKFMCPVEGCESGPFSEDRHYRLHYLRSHDEKFRRSVAGQQVKSNDQPNRLIDIIVAVLRESDSPLSIQEIVSRLNAHGYEGTDNENSLRTYIGQSIRKHPEAGVSRVARGTYELAHPKNLSTKKTRRKSSPEQDNQTVSDADEIMPIELQLALAQRQARKNQELVMKMSELVFLAMEL